MDCAAPIALNYCNTLALDGHSQLSVLRGARALEGRAQRSKGGGKRPRLAVEQLELTTFGCCTTGATGCDQRESSSATTADARAGADGLHATLRAGALLPGAIPIPVALVRPFGGNDDRGALRVVEQEQMLEPPCWFGGFGG